MIDTSPSPPPHITSNRIIGRICSHSFLLASISYFLVIHLTKYDYLNRHSSVWFSTVHLTEKNWIYWHLPWPTYLGSISVESFVVEMLNHLLQLQLIYALLLNMFLILVCTIVLYGYPCNNRFIQSLKFVFTHFIPYSSSYSYSNIQIFNWMY